MMLLHSVFRVFSRAIRFSNVNLSRLFILCLSFVGIKFLNWGSRIRTCECSSQSAVSYRLTIPQYVPDIFLVENTIWLGNSLCRVSRDTKLKCLASSPIGNTYSRRENSKTFRDIRPNWNFYKSL